MTAWWRSFLLFFSQNLALHHLTLTLLTNGTIVHIKTYWRCESCHIPQKKDQYLLSFMTAHFEDSGYETEMLHCYMSANKSYFKQCREKKNTSRLILHVSEVMLGSYCKLQLSLCPKRWKCSPAPVFQLKIN